jgi:regulator of nonsense transcripts 2
MIKAVEKLQGGVQSLADLLNLKVPNAPTALSISKTSLQIVDSGPAFGKDGDDMNTSGGIWDDDEERKFYEDILDLGLEVPPTLLGIKSNGESDTAVAPEVLSPPTETLSLHDGDTAAGEDEEGTDEHPNTNLAKDEEDGDPLQSGPAARLAAIFASLPEANNRTVIDKLAVDFAHLNSKPARKRCYKVSAFACQQTLVLTEWHRTVSRQCTSNPDRFTAPLFKVRCHTQQIHARHRYWPDCDCALTSDEAINRTI